MMSNESKQTNSYCPSIGQDGNIYNLVGSAARTLKRNGLSKEASEMSAKVFNCGSYEEALGIIGEYVNITSVAYLISIYSSLKSNGDRYTTAPK